MSLSGICPYCGWFGVTDKTLNSWCKRTYKASFSEVFRQKRGKGVHSDRRPGVCCDGVNQTYPVPLRVVDAHGLTEGTGGGG